MTALPHSFKEAVGAFQEERRRQLRVHYTPDELLAYHRGTLPGARREEVAEHLSLCEHCTILLLYGVIAPAGNGDDGEARRSESDTETRDAWNRLRPHLKNGSPRGRDLTSLREAGRLPLAEALPLAWKICRALAELHARGGVAHDLRAEAVRICPSGQVHLRDLGLTPTPRAFEVGYGQPAEDAVIDLYHTLAPEQVAGECLDQRSNLFSLGVLLYELMTGVSPFRDSTPLATLSSILSLDPTPARELRPEIPPALSASLDRLLAKEPEDRPRSAAAVARQVEAVHIALGGPRLGSGSAEEEAVAVEDEIERLYDEIIELSRAEEAGDSKGRDEAIEQAYARLLELQTAEAEKFRKRFTASLNMPIDAGEKILARTRALREKIEDLASSDPAAEEAYDPPTSAQAV